MLKEIRYGEDGNYDVKELEERVKLRKIMMLEGGGGGCDRDGASMLAMSSEASTIVIDDDGDKIKKPSRKGGPKFYLRTNQAHGI